MVYKPRGKRIFNTVKKNKLKHSFLYVEVQTYEHLLVHLDSAFLITSLKRLYSAMLNKALMLYWYRSYFKIKSIYRSQYYIQYKALVYFFTFSLYLCIYYHFHFHHVPPSSRSLLLLCLFFFFIKKIASLLLTFPAFALSFC